MIRGKAFDKQAEIDALMKPPHGWETEQWARYLLTRGANCDVPIRAECLTAAGEALLARLSDTVHHDVVAQDGVEGRGPDQ